MTSPSRTSRVRRVLAKSAIVAVALVVGVLLAEGGLRLVMRFQGRPFDAQATRVKIRTQLSPITAFVPATVGIDLADGKRRPILNPYYASEEEPDAGGVLEHFREKARPDDWEVLLLGGSVAAFLGMTEGAAIAAELQSSAALQGRRVVFLNGSHAAHKQPQQANRLALLLAFGYRPELVIAVDGFNETALASENAESNLNPVWPAAPAWSGVIAKADFASPERMDLLVEMWALKEEVEGLVERCRALRLDRTAIGSRYVLARLDGFNRERGRMQAALAALGTTGLDEREKRQLGGPEYDNDRKAVLETAVRAWSESSRSMRALCESRGIRYVHCIQPALFDAGSKKASAEEQKIENPRQSWLRGARDGYPRLRAEAAELEAGGEVVVDATRAFANVEDTVFIDPCHLNPLGNRLLRELVMARVMKDVAASR